MPAINSGKVLVTGANGYIAVWVVKALLEQGFSVRGTVRSASKGAHLKETFKSYGDKLELVVVEDITKDGAFDEAVKDVDAIEHTASPFHFNAEDPAELITPAVAGTGSVLQSALKYGINVKRVVVLSSCASVIDTSLPQPVTFSEADWNDYSIREVQAKGKNATAGDKYRASKTLAEKAAWVFYEKYKGELQWDLVVLNPPFVFGPVLHAVDSPESLNTSVKDWYTFVLKGKGDPQAVATFASAWVDVRDLAEAHVLAIKKEVAGGNRIIVSAGSFKWQDWVIEARKFAPEIPLGDTSYKSPEIYPLQYDTSRGTRLLGIPFRTKEETTRDIIANFKEKGWF
ncbi:unnamed protein product [Somion occarium]|uniref:NAD-dependent epimerase/dehydratase domain-containing protein n=1 Tax=Somion occarium TaxID=3059160 RepID=A0ABP1DQ53_9APHY